MRDRARAVSIVFLIILTMGAAPICQTGASADNASAQARSLGVLLLQEVGRDGSSLNGAGSHKLTATMKSDRQSPQQKPWEDYPFVSANTPDPIPGAPGGGMGFTASPQASGAGQAPIRAP